MSEKRQHKRSVLISYFDTYNEEEKSTVGHLVDISYGGLMLISKQPIDVNVTMELRVDMPEKIEGRESLTVRATSVRCLKDLDFDYYNTGFAFEMINDSDKQLIDHIIALFEL